MKIDVNHLAILFDRSLKIMLLGIVFNEDFIEEECITVVSMRSLQPPGVNGTEYACSSSNPNRSENTYEDVVQLISQRVGRSLERQGLLEQDTESAWLDLDPAEDTDAMSQILGSSITYRIAVGPEQELWGRIYFAPALENLGSD